MTRILPTISLLFAWELFLISKASGKELLLYALLLLSCIGNNDGFS